MDRDSLIQLYHFNMKDLTLGNMKIVQTSSDRNGIELKYCMSQNRLLWCNNQPLEKLNLNNQMSNLVMLLIARGALFMVKFPGQCSLHFNICIYGNPHARPYNFGQRKPQGHTCQQKVIPVMGRKQNPLLHLKQQPVHNLTKAENVPSLPVFMQSSIYRMQNSN